MNSEHTLNSFRQPATVRFATIMVPPPDSAQRYLLTVTDLKATFVPSYIICIYLIKEKKKKKDLVQEHEGQKDLIAQNGILTMRSLLDIPSNKEGFIHPSVTSTHPRLTALTFVLEAFLAFEKRGTKPKRTK